MQEWAFDVAVVPAGLPASGRHELSRSSWRRVVVVAHDLVEAHLLAAQLVGVHGMVVEVLYRE